MENGSGSSSSSSSTQTQTAKRRAEAPDSDELPLKMIFRQKGDACTKDSTTACKKEETDDEREVAAHAVDAAAPVPDVAVPVMQPQVNFGGLQMEIHQAVDIIFANHINKAKHGQHQNTNASLQKMFGAYAFPLPALDEDLDKTDRDAWMGIIGPICPRGCPGKYPGARMRAHYVAQHPFVYYKQSRKHPLERLLCQLFGNPKREKRACTLCPVPSCLQLEYATQYELAHHQEQVHAAEFAVRAGRFAIELKNKGVHHVQATRNTFIELRDLLCKASQNMTKEEEDQDVPPTEKKTNASSHVTRPIIKEETME